MNQIGRRRHASQCKRCAICRQSFSPHPRLGERQVLCVEAKCRKEYLRRHRRRYRARNVSEEQEYQSKSKGQRPQDYWRTYRQKHPEYREREKANAQLRKRRAKEIEFSSQPGSQRQLDILQAPKTTGESDVSMGSQRQLDRDSNPVLVDGVAIQKRGGDAAANAKEFFLDRPSADPDGYLGEALSPGATDLRCPVCHMRPGGLESLERTKAPDISRD
jgi:hypothetical protein